MTTTFQSMDHSSAMKKTRQQLQESELGITPVHIDMKKGSKPIQHVRKLVMPTKDTSPHLESSLSELRKKHAQDMSSIRAESSTLKGSLFESRKETSSKLAHVDNQISDLKNKVDSLKKDNETLPSSLDLSSKFTPIHQEISKLQSQVKSIEQQLLSLKKETEMKSVSVKSVDPKEIRNIEERVLSVQKAQDSKYLEHDSQIKQLNTTVRDISSKLSYAQAAASTLPSVSKGDHVKSLHVGDQFNLPEQPVAVKEGGLHKIAPLSLTVNGAVLLHDIGYTTEKKGLVPLYYDPVTQRALIYHGK